MSWNLNVPEAHADEFEAKLASAGPSPTDADPAQVAAAKSAISTLFATLVAEEGGLEKSYKASAHGSGAPHNGVTVGCTDSAASWN